MLEAPEARLRSEVVSLVSGSLEPFELEAALDSGVAMTLDEAVEYALASID
jgi:hypothetical protein